jgi:hypothetical protein
MDLDVETMGEAWGDWAYVPPDRAYSGILVYLMFDPQGMLHGYVND